MGEPTMSKTSERYRRIMTPILAPTVWAFDRFADEPRIRGIFHWVLPLTDVAFIWFGVVGVLNGVRSVQDVTSVSWQTGWSALLSLSAMCALVGISISKLWPLEVVGKVILFGCTMVYIGVYFARGHDNPQTVATAGLFHVLIFVVLWRLGDLGADAMRPWVHNIIARRRARALKGVDAETER